jgi:hypothetical protein
MGDTFSGWFEMKFGWRFNKGATAPEGKKNILSWDPCPGWLPTFAIRECLPTGYHLYLSYSIAVILIPVHRLTLVR